MPIPNTAITTETTSSHTATNEEQENKTKKRAGKTLPDFSQMLPYKPKLRPRKSLMITFLENAGDKMANNAQLFWFHFNSPFLLFLLCKFQINV